MCYCEACKKETSIKTQSSHINSAAHIENEVISRTNNNLTDKTYTYFNPDFEKVDNLYKRAIDECTHHFHKFIYKCEFVVKFDHAIHGDTNYFKLKNKLKINMKK